MLNFCYVWWPTKFVTFVTFVDYTLLSIVKYSLVPFADAPYLALKQNTSHSPTPRRTSSGSTSYWKTSPFFTRSRCRPLSTAITKAPFVFLQTLLFMDARSILTFIFILSAKLFHQAMSPLSMSQLVAWPPTFLQRPSITSNSNVFAPIWTLCSVHNEGECYYFVISAYPISFYGLFLYLAYPSDHHQLYSLSIFLCCLASYPPQCCIYSLRCVQLYFFPSYAYW